MLTVRHFRPTATAFGWALLLLTTILLACGPTNLAHAQAQAINGQIEGVITDANGAALPNASVKAVNLQTGVERATVSDDNGVYRLPLLPLGTYRVTAELTGFKKLVREGVTLVTGQIATVNLELPTGGVNEEVTVTADASIADPGKIDLGRVMNANEVQNLPLVSRNPYNFAQLQANVTGRPNIEFGVPRINANGYARRTNYQLDGNSNTQTDRAGIRLMPISEIFVSEVQLVTNGFAAEFGGTPGLIMNAVTPSGTNLFHGSASYRFRRTAMSSRPFNTSPTSLKPKTKVDNVTGAIGGPIIKDRWHFYAGYEYVKRDLAGEPQRVITVTDANKQALIAAGVSASIFPTAIPAAQKVPFYIVRSDFQLNSKHRITGRYNRFRNTSPNNIAGGITTLERSIDFLDLAYSFGGQLVSTFSANALNEFRFQYAKRDSRNERNGNSGTGPAILITNIAAFGSPENAATIQPLEKITQFLDNFTLTRGTHTMKFGGGFSYVDDVQKSGVFARYTFPSIAAYVAARNGTATRGYTSYIEAFGNPQIAYKSVFYNFFAQDDWKATRRLKLNYGVRYDLYDVPQADPNAPFAASRDFKVDKNNFAPRLGLVYALREGNRPTILRASAGLYYEAPLIDIYRRALLNSGSPRFFNFTFQPATAGSPAFPTTLGSLPSSSALPRQSIETVAPDYKNLYAAHTNLQLEQALANDWSVTLGFIHSNGRHIPIYRNINPINPIGTLADGRPIFSTTISAATRRDPTFNNILMVEAAGNSDYTAGTLSLNKRLSRGYQFSANYTWSHSLDDAPEQNLVAVQNTNLVLSDPTNRRRDRGNSLADQRHTFVMSFVGRPDFKLENRFARRLLNDNQLGLIVTANSGETFNIVANPTRSTGDTTSSLDLNNDGITSSDRPLFIGRNTGRTPNQFNADLRYSRFLTFTERYKAEIIAEFINVFNVNSIFQVGPTVNVYPVCASAACAADPAGGTLRAPLPNFTTINPTSLDSRQFQLGFKFIF